MTINDNLVRLTVPYGRKDLAKKLGAKWDSRTKSWYIMSSLTQKVPKNWIVG